MKKILVQQRLKQNKNLMSTKDSQAFKQRIKKAHRQLTKELRGTTAIDFTDHGIFSKEQLVED